MQVGLCVCIHTGEYAHTYVYHVRVCIHARTCVYHDCVCIYHMHLHTKSYIHEFIMYACVRAYIYVHVCVCVLCVRVYIYT